MSTMPDTDRKVFWQGKGRVTNRRFSHQLHYCGCVVGGLHIEVGDCVLISMEGAMDADCEEEAYVAQIIDMYDSGSPIENYRMLVQWYWREVEFKYYPKKSQPKFAHSQELLLNTSKIDHDLELTSIINTCIIERLKPAQKPNPPDDFVNDYGQPWFYAKRSYDGKRMVDWLDDGVDENHNTTLTSLENHPISEGHLVKDKSVKKNSTKKENKKAHGKENNVEEALVSPSLGKRHTYSSRHVTDLLMNDDDLPPSRSTPRSARKSLNMLTASDLLKTSSATKKKLLPLPDIDSDDDDDDTGGLTPGKIGSPCSSPKTAKPRKSHLKTVIYSANVDDQCTLKVTDNRSSAATPTRRSSKKSVCYNSDTDIDDQSPKKSKKVPIVHSQSISTPKQRKSGKPAGTPSRKSERISKVEKHAPKEVSVPNDSTPSTPSTPRSSRRVCSVRTPKSSSVKKTPTRKKTVRKATEVLDNSSDDDNYIPEKKTRNTPSRTPRRKGGYTTPCGTPRGTPRSSRNTPGTPSLPSRLISCNTPTTPLEHARARLHVSARPDTLPCREDEFADIYFFVQAKIVDKTGGCMYISGVPGTGKTATANQVRRALEDDYEAGEIPAFRWIEINGMRLTDPHQASVKILQQLTGQKATADHATALLEKRFNTPDPRREPVVLLVDELDLLWTRKQTVMYNIFDWPTKPEAKLIVLAIANTMDLPERMMMNKIASRLGLTRMTFQPYTYKQLEEIVLSRIRGIEAFDEDAVQLAARKVAALSGDARRALDICRRATDLAESMTISGKAQGIVGMVHVNKAIEEMFSAPKIVAMRNAAIQEKMLLRAIVTEFQRTGIEEASFDRVYTQHVTLCRFHGIQPPNASELSSICSRLGSFRMLLIEAGRADLNQRIRLNVSQDDVQYALKNFENEM